MSSVGIKQLSALFLMVLLAVSSVNAGGMKAVSCFFDELYVTAAADDSRCLTSTPATNAEYHEASCFPFAQSAAGQVASAAPAKSQHWLRFQPFPQRFPNRFDKPPRISLPL